MSDHVAALVRIKGRVQGVGYRYFAQASAAANGLSGWIRTLLAATLKVKR